MTCDILIDPLSSLHFLPPLLGGLPLVHEDDVHVAGYLEAAPGHGEERLGEPAVPPPGRRHHHAVSPGYAPPNTLPNPPRTTIFW
jgi:hypothetical protein